MQMIDHVGRVLSLPDQANRIVSLCPSITETLFDLGLGDRVVGRTRYCIHPEPEVREVPSVGGTKKIEIGRLREVKPDLIIGEKEENTPEMIRELEGDYPVFVADVTDLQSSIQMIEDVGLITQKKEEAHILAEQVRASFAAIEPLHERKMILYFIWRDPYMVAGGNTFIDSMLGLCNFHNLGKGLSGRYPSLTQGQIKELSPEIILLSSEPYPFKAKHIEELSNLLPNSRIELVDGEMFTWYGSRMLKAPAYLNPLLRSLAKPGKTL